MRQKNCERTPRKTANTQRLARLYATLEQHPGIGPALLARLAGYNPDNINARLLSLEIHGYLISEDEHNHLYPFARPGEVPQ